MIEIRYTVQLSSPTRISTGMGSAGYLDNTIIRDSHGRAYLPGSSIKGKVRAAFYRLAATLTPADLHLPEQEPAGCLCTAAPCLVCRVFGAAQWPSALYFDNACLHPNLLQVIDSLDMVRLRRNQKPAAAIGFGRELRTNVAIDRQRRSALPNHLFSFEAIGTEALFQGRIAGEVRGDSSRLAAALLCASLRMITHLGGGRGRGYGRCAFLLDTAAIDGSEVPANELIEELTGKGEQHDPADH